MTITRHYCGNRLVSVNILSEPDKCCDDNNCCHDESITIKLNADILNSSFDYSVILLTSNLLTEPGLVSYNNSFLHKNPIKSITGFLDLPTPELSIFLSKLGILLL